MKYLGDNFLLEKERNEEIYRIFKKLYFEKGMKIDDIAEEITRMPSRRFWISEQSAAVVISRMMQGRKCEQKQEMKKKMYQEIFRRTREMEEQLPAGTSIRSIVGCVVRQSAPLFYMKKHTIKRAIYRILNGWYRRRRKAQSQRP